VQEGKKSCPDDSSEGSFITFEFREPVEYIKLISFLNNEAVLLTPDITLTYDGGKRTVFSAPYTGENRLASVLLNRDPSHKRVTMVEVENFGSGAIDSLEYPYCAQTPKPLTSIKKYGGPVDACSASGLSSVQDMETLAPISRHGHTVM